MRDRDVAEAPAEELRVARRRVIEAADAARAGGSGLSRLMDRVAALDGDLTIDSPRGSGTVLRAEIPLPH